MNISLPPEQERWLRAHIANGEFASVDDAVRRIIADRMALDADDLAWAKPYVDDARAAAARGEVVSLDEAIADLNSATSSAR